MDLSYEKKLTCDPFYLIPIMLKDCIPGDKWQIGLELVVRMMPLAAPIMHEINCYTHYYFVPYRLLWSDWENFITRGRDGRFTAAIPVWAFSTDWTNPSEYGPGSLFDYMEMNAANVSTSVTPNGFPQFAYNMIWNEYYRDQNLTNPVSLNYYAAETDGLHIRCWEKDYFTSMLPWQQRGDPVALPVNVIDNPVQRGLVEVGFPDGVIGNLKGTSPPTWDPVGTIPPGVNPGNAFVDFSNLKMSTFDVSDLRAVFAIQRWQEKNARGGVRYVEFLKNQYITHPRDDRLQRPEYIGGTKTPIIVSEVLQTSRSEPAVNPTQPLGSFGGHGISADRMRVGSYYVQEHGLIMGIMSFMPRSMYQQGVDRTWLKRSYLDYYFHEFRHLSEQAVYQAEIDNVHEGERKPYDKIGFQGHWDEYRTSRNVVCGLFKTDFNYWHMGRIFADQPILNQDLVRPSPAEITSLKRVLAVPSQPMFMVSVGNVLHATRPMPWMSEPGMVDH
jgi:hypothetical protein